MATRRFMTDPGEALENVTQATGAANVTKNIELTVNLANVKDGSTKAITKEDVLLALDRFREYLVQNIWPPA